MRITEIFLLFLLKLFSKCRSLTLKNTLLCNARASSGVTSRENGDKNAINKDIVNTHAVILFLRFLCFGAKGEDKCRNR